MSSNTGDYYRYAPLTPKSIRLLRIYPGHRYRSQLKIELRNCPLEDAEYNALSYPWGPATLEEQDELAVQIFTTVARCYPIICEGRIVLVTRSLRNALLRLRSLNKPELAELLTRTWKPRKAQYYWADGICIDQDNAKERSQQVALMAELYSHSRMTIAHLGEPADEPYDKADERVRSALQTASVLDQLSKDLHERGESISSFDHSNLALFARINRRAPLLEEWWEWCIFLSRAWFQRTWIVQEAILSRGDKLIMICGKLGIELAAVLNGVSMLHRAKCDVRLWAQLLSSKHTSARYQRYEPTIKSWIGRIHPYNYVARAWHREPTFQTVFLNIIRHTQCSNPLDRIYGTLGIASEWQHLDQRLLPIDYEQSVKELYCRATKYLISKSSSLAILCSVKMSSPSAKKHDLPSWCPDYTDQYSGPNSLADLPGEPWSVNWASSRESLCSIPIFDTAWAELHVCGRHVGNIEAVASVDHFLAAMSYEALQLLLATVSVHETDVEWVADLLGHER